MQATVPVSGCRQERRARIHPPCPHGDQPEISCLRLVLIGDILQQSSLLPLSEEPTASPARREASPPAVTEGHSVLALRSNAWLCSPPMVQYRLAAVWCFWRTRRGGSQRWRASTVKHGT